MCLKTFENDLVFDVFRFSALLNSSLVQTFSGLFEDANFTITFPFILEVPFADNTTLVIDLLPGYSVINIIHHDREESDMAGISFDRVMTRLSDGVADRFFVFFPLLFWAKILLNWPENLFL